jgi:hypothetical protein
MNTVLSRKVTYKFVCLFIYLFIGLIQQQQIIFFLNVLDQCEGCVFNITF